MRMDDPKPQFIHLVTELKKRHPQLAYLHVPEPVASGPQVRKHRDGENNDFLREIWAPKQYISAGGFNRASGIAAAEKTEELYAYGRWFISNVCSFYIPYRCIN
jgi:NADPH2 dehydrogenase